MNKANTSIETTPLIRTKLNIPRISDDLIERPRLIERLNQGLSRKVTLISAPAGYGKTTLASQWLTDFRFADSDFGWDPVQENEIQKRVAWLSLSKSDSDLALFLNYTITAIQTIFPNACPDTGSLLQATPLPPIEYLVSTLINEIAVLPANPADPSSGQDFILVLEDYHRLGESDIHQLLSSLIEHQPAQMHLVIISRQDPFQLPITQLRARQEMIEIRQADLRFNPEETHAFLTQALGVKLPDETVAALDRWIEGWVVGLRLASLSMRDLDDPTTFVQALTGTDRYVMEYLVDEVLARQPKAIQTFMLQTSILDRLCGSLGEAVTGLNDPECNGQAYLEWLERSNTFLILLDNKQEWYRYHHLFQDLLAGKLQTEYPAAEIATLHRRASQWFADHGYVDEALQHALSANNVQAAVKLVEDNSHNLLNRLERHVLEKWISMLPQEVVWQRPRLLIVQAWLLYRQARWAALDVVLDRTEASLNANDDDLASEEKQALCGQVNTLRSASSILVCNDFQRGLLLAERALQQLPVAEGGAQSTALVILAFTQRALGKEETAARRLEEVIHNPTPFSPAKIQAFIGLSLVHLMAGDLQQMHQTTRHFLAFATESKNANAIVGVNWVAGLLQHEWNDLEAATAHFSSVFELRYHSNFAAIFNSILGSARIYQMQGKLDKTQETLNILRTETMRLHNTDFLPPLDSVQANQWLLQGDVASALRWARTFQPGAGGESFVWFEVPSLMQTRILTAHGTDDEVQATQQNLQDRLAEAESRHFTRRVIQILGHLALVYHRLGQMEKALDSLQRALTLAQPGGFIRSFVDCGPALIPLLQCLDRQHVTPTYLPQVLAAFNIAPTKTGASVSQTSLNEPGLIEFLTRREEEILHLMQAGMTNKEIAHELVISPFTVKKHASNIFGKLAVNSRRQAIRKARQLGILSK